MRGALVAVALACAACGGGGGDDGDDPDGPPAVADARPDATVAATFTAFVIDLVENQTSDTTEPVPFAAFMSLPDPDLDNPAAYDVLFQ